MAYKFFTTDENKQELREPAIYNAIIKAIAEGASWMNNIKMKVGEGKKTIYLLADNFFRFWYRFVPVNMSAIDSGRIAKTYPHAVKQ